MLQACVGHEEGVTSGSAFSAENRDGKALVFTRYKSIMDDKEKSLPTDCELLFCPVDKCQDRENHTMALSIWRNTLIHYAKLSPGTYAVRQFCLKEMPDTKSKDMIATGPTGLFTVKHGDNSVYIGDMTFTSRPFKKFKKGYTVNMNLTDKNEEVATFFAKADPIVEENNFSPFSVCLAQSALFFRGLELEEIARKNVCKH